MPHIVIPGLPQFFEEKIVLTNFLNGIKYFVSINFDLFDVQKATSNNTYGYL